MGHSLRLTLRSLRRSPAFTISAVLCIAIAIALSTSMAAILDAVKHPYVPFADPDRLAHVVQYGRTTRPITEGDWREVLEATTFVEAVTFTTAVRTVVEGDNHTDDRIVSYVRPNFFRFLKVKPAQGRFLAETGADADAAVISDRLSRIAFPVRSSAIGATLSVNGRAYTVVGVAPVGTERATWSDVWVAASGQSGTSEPPRLTPVIRIKSRPDSLALKNELDAIARRLEQSHGGTTRPVGLRLNSFQPDPYSFKTFHAALATAGLIVLLVACGNVANLLLARALEKRPEHVLRIALGASPMRVARQSIVESSLLCALGCVLGVLLAVWCMAIISANRPTALGWLGVLDPHLNWRVLAYAAVASILIAVASAVIPMLRIARADPGEILKAGAATMTRVARRRDALVIVQLALALVLLFCAGILARSALSLTEYDFGYDPKPFATADVYFLKDSVDTDSAFRELATHAERLPGVQSATLVSSLGVERGIVTADEHTDSLGVMIKRTVRVVDPSFFHTLRVPLIAGRDFQPGDEEHGAVIVDQEAARKLWRGDSVVGRSLKLGDPRSTRPWLRVVGVIKVARLGIATDPYLLPEPDIFVVQKRMGRGASIVVRTEMPSVGANHLRRLLRERLRLQGRNYYSTVGTLTEGFESMLSVRWFMAALFAVFAAFTLALALAGIYGTLGYSVSRRMREFGVRRALGATDIDLRKLVLTQAAIAILAATAIGGPAGLMAARLLDGWLYGVWYTDAMVLISAEAVLIGTAFVACIPAMRRAARMETASVLKEL